MGLEQRHKLLKRYHLYLLLDEEIRGYLPEMMPLSRIRERGKRRGKRLRYLLERWEEEEREEKKGA